MTAGTHVRESPDRLLTSNDCIHYRVGILTVFGVSLRYTSYSNQEESR